MGKLTRVLEKSGYEVKLKPLKKPEQETEVEFCLGEEEESGTGNNQREKVERVSQDRERDPIISEEWDDLLRKIVHKYRRSTASLRLLRSKIFSHNK
ncbi:hypothetical protein [Desulforhopalus sp. 52FAK]